MAKKILIIDDDADFINSVTQVLQSKEYAVVSAPNGKDGVAKAKDQAPDLILLDVMMTRKTEGFDVAKQLNGDAATKNIPVIIMTGIRREFNLPFGFEPDQKYIPVKTILEKPVKPDVLLGAIAKALG